MFADDDDRDWEEEAKEGEAEEQRRKFLHRVAHAHTEGAVLSKRSLQIGKLEPDTKLIITFSGESDEQIEFTILDPGTGKVYVKDGSNFTEPTVGKLVGCKEFSGKFWPGELKWMCWLVYEVDGKTYTAFDTIRNARLVLPTGTEFDVFGVER